MKVVIFGATGGTGKQLVEQALSGGHDVVAFARDRSKLGITQEHLNVVQGELSDRALIEEAIQGSDAVLSALGPRGRSKGEEIAQGTLNIVESMKKSGVRRLIITSTLSAKDPNDRPDFRTKAMVSLVKFAMHGAYEDIVRSAEIVRASDLDWTIVRLAMLNNKPRKGHVRMGYVGRGEVGAGISRADVADFMLKQISDLSYLRQAPAISD